MENGKVSLDVVRRVRDVYSSLACVLSLSSIQRGDVGKQFLFSGTFSGKLGIVVYIKQLRKLIEKGSRIIWHFHVKLFLLKPL